MKKKRIYIVGVIVLLLIVVFVFRKEMLSEKKEQEESKTLKSYEISVIEGSEQSKKSTITYYDKDLKEVKKQKLPYGALCGYVEPILYNGKVYLVAQGVFDHPSNVVLEMDLKTGEQKEYRLKNKSIITDFRIDDKNMYYVCNLNGVSYIGSVNRKTMEEKVIKIKEERKGNGSAVMELELKDGSLYAFGDNYCQGDKIPSYIYEIDVNKFSIINTIDASKYGENCISECFQGDNMYLVYAQKGEKTELDYICVYSLTTKKMRKINVGVKEPLQVKEHNGLIYILHSDMHDKEDTSSSITVYNPKTGKRKNIKLGRHISSIDFKNDKLYMYGSDILAIYKQKKNHNFVLEKEKDVYTEKNGKCYYYVSGFFVRE